MLAKAGGRRYARHMTICYLDSPVGRLALEADRRRRDRRALGEPPANAARDKPATPVLQGGGAPARALFRRQAETLRPAAGRARHRLPEARVDDDARDPLRRDRDLWRHGDGAGLGPARRRHGLRPQSHPHHRALPSRAGQRRQGRRLLGRPGPADQAASCWRWKASSFFSSSTVACVGQECPGYGERMRVLITRPEREATALATALAERGHAPVIAPLFRLELLHPPADFAASLAACQAVLLTSANGARALAEASEQRGRPILAVGDTTATHRRGAGLQRRHLGSGRWRRPGRAGAPAARPQGGPAAACVGRRRRGRSRRALQPTGFEVQPLRALRGARGDRPAGFGAGRAGGARARCRHLLLAARGVAVSPGWSKEAGLADSLRNVTAVAISPAAAGAARRPAVQGDRGGSAADPPGRAG